MRSIYASESINSSLRCEQVKKHEDSLREFTMKQMTEGYRSATKRCEVYVRAEIIPFESAT